MRIRHGYGYAETCADADKARIRIGHGCGYATDTDVLSARHFIKAKTRLRHTKDGRVRVVSADLSPECGCLFDAGTVWMRAPFGCECRLDAGTA